MSHSDKWQTCWQQMLQAVLAVQRKNAPNDPLHALKKLKGIKMLATLFTWRWSARSALLPVNAMIMFGFPCRCSSFTHVFAFAKLSALLMSNTITAAAAPLPAQHTPQHALRRLHCTFRLTDGFVQHRFCYG